jgi:hypothetical protein
MQYITQAMLRMPNTLKGLVASTWDHKQQRQKQQQQQQHQDK